LTWTAAYHGVPRSRPGDAQAVKAGDKVKFDADKINGQFTLTKIQKAK
jgi:hypothetical protein